MNSLQFISLLRIVYLSCIHLIPEIIECTFQLIALLRIMFTYGVFTNYLPEMIINLFKFIELLRLVFTYRVFTRNDHKFVKPSRVAPTCVYLYGIH